MSGCYQTARLSTKTTVVENVQLVCSFNKGGRSSYQLDLLLEVYYLREEVRDLLLLPGGVIAFSGQFFRQRCDLKVGIAWNDGQDQNLTKKV